MCGTLEQAAADPECPVEFDEELNEYKLEVGFGSRRFANIVHPDVAAIAMRRLARAACARGTGQIRAIQESLERMLPELPGACLPEIVGDEAYRAACDRIAKRKTTDAELSAALTDLRSYL